MVLSRTRERCRAGMIPVEGWAVWRDRDVKSSGVAVSWAVLEKSLGETIFFCTMEKKISIWFSQDAWTGVWIMMAFGWAARSRRAAFLPRGSEPLSTRTNTRGALREGSWALPWPTSAMAWATPAGGGGPAA